MTPVAPLVMPPAVRASARWPALWSAALVVGGLTATTKVAALMKDSLVASRFGSGAELDAFLLALVVPGFMIGVAAGTLPAALTPTYIAVREREGVGAARVLARAVFASTYRWLVAAAVVAGLVSLVYTAIPGSHLAPTTRESLPRLAAWLAPYTLLQGVCAAWSGLLAAERGYAASTMAPIAQPLGMALAVLLAGRSLGVGALVVGLLGGTIVQALIFAAALHQRGLPIVAWRTPIALSSASRAAIARVHAQYLPAVAAALLMSATTVVDQTMATWLPPGSVSALAYGTKLSAVLMSVGAVALSTTLLPHLSELVAREEWSAIRRVERRVVWMILGATIPATIVLILAAQPTVRLLFQRGAFTAVETTTVANVQSAYLLQLPVHLLGILYVRLISALQANRLLTIGAAVNLAVNIALNVLFMRWFGVVGIALSTAGVYAVSCLFLATVVRRRLAASERDTLARKRPLANTPVSSEVPCASAA